tara:strand:+ start:373 stop:990 length:618 start_codon:yes stop_codon:yes gene_type:complete
MLKKTIIILTLCTSILFGGKPNFHPMVKSAILPGWGEAAKKNTQRSRLFFLTETVLWTATMSAYTFSAHQAKQYKSFAVAHAGIDARGKERQYWVDIGNYQDLTSHNDEHLRFRDIEALYPQGEGWEWEWDSKQNRDDFEAMRIRSDRFAHAGKFLIGGIVMNHIISAIDALYLTRLEKIEAVTLSPKVEPSGYSSLYLQVDFNF